MTDTDQYMDYTIDTIFEVNTEENIRELFRRRADYDADERYDRKRLAKAEAQIVVTTAEIAVNTARIALNTALAAERDSLIAQIAVTKAQIAGKDALTATETAQITEKDALTAMETARMAEKDALIAVIDAETAVRAAQTAVKYAQFIKLNLTYTKLAQGYLESLLELSMLRKLLDENQSL